MYDEVHETETLCLVDGLYGHRVPLPAAQPVAMAARATVAPTSCAGYACRLKD